MGLDCRPDKSGLDDGPELPRWVIREFKKTEALKMREQGISLRTIAGALGVSHEAVRVWTAGVTKD